MHAFLDIKSSHGVRLRIVNVIISGFFLFLLVLITKIGVIQDVEDGCN